MRQRFLVGTKLVETLSRGFFVLACTYRLPLVDAGQFGLMATIVGLLAFMIGFERQIDVLRQTAGRSDTVTRHRMRDTLRFFGVQYLLVLPLAALALHLTLAWDWASIGCVLLVIVGEHLSNQCYQAILIDKRAFPLLITVAAKNSVLLVAVVAASVRLGPEFDATYVLHVWTWVSVVFITLITGQWRRWMAQPVASNLPPLPPQFVVQQYRASWLHFTVGLVAVAALQADRLVVGGILTAVEVGIYFRNIAFVGLALQVFNIVSFNRVAPGVYDHSRNGRLAQSRKVVVIEYQRFALTLVLLLLTALGVNLLLSDPAASLGLKTPFLLMLCLGVLLRTLADYLGLLLLSVGGDRRLLYNQAAAVVSGIASLAFLASIFGLPGAFAGSIATPLIYLLLNQHAVSRRYSTANC